MTDDNLLPFSFPAVSRKKVTAAFDGGCLTSDGGVMLLAMAENRLGIADRLARCFPDHRDQTRIVHTRADMIRAASTPSPAAMRTLTIWISCEQTRHSNSPAGGYPTPARIFVRSRRCRGWKMRRR